MSDQAKPAEEAAIPARMPSIQQVLNCTGRVLVLKNHSAVSVQVHDYVGMARITLTREELWAHVVHCILALEALGGVL